MGIQVFQSELGPRWREDDVTCYILPRRA